MIYLFLAGILTCSTMIYVARRMQARPNRVQTLVEPDLSGPPRRQHRRVERWIAGWPTRWFPFIATLALFIFFSNLIGFIPLPTNTAADAYINIFGWHIPPFSLYAATANLSIPLVLAIIVFVSYTAPFRGDPREEGRSGI